MFGKFFGQNFVRRYAVKTSKSAKVKANSWFDNVPMAQSDLVFGLQELYDKDTHPLKVNCSVGAFHNENGKPYVLQSVREAERRIGSLELDKENLPIVGLPAFNESAAELVFGSQSRSLQEQRIVSAQTIGGCAALSLLATLVAKYFDGNKLIHLSNPCWPNYAFIFRHNIGLIYYRYYDAWSNDLDFSSMCDDIRKMHKNSIILLQACAHNPTGIDPNYEQWLELAVLIKQKKLLPIIDVAYQGLASGDIETDVLPIRQFEQAGNKVVVTQTFSDNMGLYGERIGALHIVCENTEAAACLRSQMKNLIRATYSEPTLHGARLVSEVLKDESLRSAWSDELSGIVKRTNGMRRKLRDELHSCGSKISWNHLIEQNGLYCYTGVTPAQTERLMKEFHIYMPRNGSLLVASLTNNNVTYIANALHYVTKK